MWGEITFININEWTIKFWKWVCNFIRPLIMDKITYPWLKSNQPNKRGPWYQNTTANKERNVSYFGTNCIRDMIFKYSSVSVSLANDATALNAKIRIRYRPAQYVSTSQMRCRVSVVIIHFKSMLLNQWSLWTVVIHNIHPKAPY